jgi:hypothetical protein
LKNITPLKIQTGKTLPVLLFEELQASIVDLMAANIRFTDIAMLLPVKLPL